MLDRLRACGIRDPKVLEAMRDVPRHFFVPEALRGRAYGDYALPISFNQTISQPFIVARMTELLALDKVDLSPSDLTLAALEERLRGPVLKRSGDFRTTRLGGVCGKERCAIWATFLVPFGQDIPSNAVPAGLTIKSPGPGLFPNIRIREFRL